MVMYEYGSNAILTKPIKNTGIKHTQFFIQDAQDTKVKKKPLKTVHFGQLVFWLLKRSFEKINY